jgi:hypothetical protein
VQSNNPFRPMPGQSGSSELRRLNCLTRFVPTSRSGRFAMDQPEVIAVKGPLRQKTKRKCPHRSNGCCRGGKRENARHSF